MSEQERILRQRIYGLKGAIARCDNPAQREALINRLLDTDDQLLTEVMLRGPRARRMVW